jgi:hypothetical protein
VQKLQQLRTWGGIVAAPADLEAALLAPPRLTAVLLTHDHCSCSDKALSEIGVELLPIQIPTDKYEAIDPSLVRGPGPPCALGTAAKLQKHMHALEDVLQKPGAHGYVIGIVLQQRQ